LCKLSLDNEHECFSKLFEAVKEKFNNYNGTIEVSECTESLEKVNKFIYSLAWFVHKLRDKKNDQNPNILLTLIEASANAGLDNVEVNNSIDSLASLLINLSDKKTY
jgi:hypothetical protein